MLFVPHHAFTMHKNHTAQLSVTKRVVNEFAVEPELIYVV